MALYSLLPGDISQKYTQKKGCRSSLFEFFGTVDGVKIVVTLNDGNLCAVNLWNF